MPRFLPHPFGQSRYLRPIAADWAAVSLRQYLLLGRLPRPANSLDRLRWQLVALSPYTHRELRRWPLRRLNAAARRIHAFVHTPPESPPRRTLPLPEGRERAVPSELGAAPLRLWIALERSFLKEPAQLEALRRGELAGLPQLLAILLSEDGLPEEELREAVHTAPVTAAVGVANWFFLELLKLERQYPMLFEEQQATPENAEAAAYFRRWGWTAVLAELAGGHLTPTAREELLDAPIHVMFQELARREDHLQLLKSQA